MLHGVPSKRRQWAGPAAIASWCGTRCGGAAAGSEGPAPPSYCNSRLGLRTREPASLLAPHGASWRLMAKRRGRDARRTAMPPPRATASDLLRGSSNFGLSTMSYVGSRKHRTSLLGGTAWPGRLADWTRVGAVQKRCALPRPCHGPCPARRGAGISASALRTAMSTPPCNEVRSTPGCQ